jgi:Domain of unknown function (DUF5623)
MSSEAIRPSTLDGIKRLAKAIKGERGIQHLSALEDAARSAGFQNFKHARNVLTKGPERTHTRPGHRLFLTVYWRDKDSDSRGRETLTVWLGTLWSELITPAQMDHHRALTHFQQEGPDHLARRDTLQSQSQARRAICAAARTLQFMDTTKLRPSKSHSRAFPAGQSSNAVPGRDHYSIWYDRESKRYLFADEPYELAVAGRAAERTAWSVRHGFDIAKPSWPGMYNPDGGTRLYLIADAAKGISLAPIVAALNRLPVPVVEADWDGESAPFTPMFVSPGTIARNQAAAQAPTGARKVTRGPRSTVGYVQTFVGPQRRPKGRMPIEAHAQVGKLLKSVLVASFNRKGVYNRVNGIRSELDEWTQREYTHAELPSEQFFDLYYHESGGSFARSLSPDQRAIHVGSLERAKQILTQHYPDSSPLRALVKKLDAAVVSMQSWGA